MEVFIVTEGIMIDWEIVCRILKYLLILFLLGIENLLNISFLFMI